jgi:hypothetical protein
METETPVSADSLKSGDSDNLKKEASGQLTLSCVSRVIVVSARADTEQSRACADCGGRTVSNKAAHKTSNTICLTLLTDSDGFSYRLIFLDVEVRLGDGFFLALLLVK